MAEEMERSVYRGDWASETSHDLIRWSSDISLATQVKDDSSPVCDDSMVFSEPKQIYSQLQFSELGVPSSTWEQDRLGIRSGLRCDNRFSNMAPAINNMLKQEHPSNLDSESLVGDSLLLTRKLSAMPPWFPATVREGTCTSLGSKALLMGGGNNQLLVFGNDTPPWKGSLETAGTPQSSGGSSWKKGWERSATCNVALKDIRVDTKKSADECAPKRIRSDAQVPFTTFKVRKEKLGDRITALQQLVSPFGKTDTASVLFDAIEYIKFLHEQVTVLSTPYMMLSTSLDREEAKGKGGLRSRGLCLVPISTSLHVAKDNTTDFWAPTFGGSYR